MITMINERNGHKTRFKSYQKLFDHIGHNQRTKRYNKSHQPIDDWFLARHSYRRVVAFYEFIANQKIADQEKNPGRTSQKFDVLEMSYDCSTAPVIMPITPDRNIQSLLEHWCKRFCAFHGYKLVEVQDDDGMLHVKRTHSEQDL
jgi:hypothetical protein